jgi:hypothetical protein
MAYGSFAGLDGYIGGFQPSKEGTDALGGMAAKKYETGAALAGNALASLAYSRAQKRLADAQVEAAQIQANAANDPLRLGLGVLGTVGAAFVNPIGKGLSEKMFG